MAKSMATETVAIQTLENLEERSRFIEDNHLTFFKRLKRRWLKKEIVLAWNISSWVTIGQLVFGKKLWVWVTAKVPWIMSLGKTIWGGIMTAFAAVVSIFTP